MHLTKGLSARMISSLLACGQDQDPLLYHYDPIRKDALLANATSAPWPVQWICTSFHRKHVFPPARLPEISSLSKSMAIWENRTRWKLWFAENGGEDDEDTAKWRFMHSKNADCKPCPYLIDPNASCFLRQVSESVLCHARRATAKAARQKLAFCTPPLVKFALRSMEVLQIDAVPTDKDGGFALCSDDGMSVAVDQVLVSTHYDCFLSASAWKLRIDPCIDLFEPYELAARAISVNDKLFRKALFSEVKYGLEGMISKLNLTVKTHKPNNEVVCRAIHSYVNCPMAPGMRWIMKCLNDRLVHLPHLLRDSSDLLCKAKRVRLTSTCRFIKFDIKDFYMSGSFSELTSFASRAVDCSIRTDFSLLLDAVLNSQYVRSPTSGEVYKVKVGTGMGMLASGHVADAAFYEMVEKPFILKASTREHYSILFCARFKDDGILIFDAQDGIQHIAEFMNRVHEISRSFVVKLESISRTGCQMLDVFVSRDDFLRPHFVLFKKPSSIWQPLSPESAHHISIHKHWPLAQCKRIRERFSSPVEAELEVDSFKRAFFEATGVWLNEQIVSTKNQSNTSSWIVLPFNFALSNCGLSDILHNLKVPRILPFSNIRVSWSLGNKHLMHLLRRKMDASQSLEEESG